MAWNTISFHFCVTDTKFDIENLIYFTIPQPFLQFSPFSRVSGGTVWTTVKRRTYSGGRTWAVILYRKVVIIGWANGRYHWAISKFHSFSVITISYNILYSSGLNIESINIVCAHSIVVELRTGMYTGLLVNRSSDQSCNLGMIHHKIHFINPGCPRPSIAEQCSIYYFFLNDNDLFLCCI